MTIKEAQERVDAWIKEYGVRYFDELTNMAILTEEVGEVARIMARRYGEQSFKEGEKSDLGDEIADVLWVLICIANQTGIDLTEALQKNLDKKTKRDCNRHNLILERLWTRRPLYSVLCRQLMNNPFDYCVCLGIQLLQR